KRPEAVAQERQIRSRRQLEGRAREAHDAPALQRFRPQLSRVVLAGLHQHGPRTIAPVQRQRTKGSPRPGGLPGADGFGVPEEAVVEGMPADRGAVSTTTSFLRARVSATFMRRMSARNPRSPASLLRVSETITASFSRPWKPSTVSTSRSSYAASLCRKSCTCASYGAITARSRGDTRASRRPAP